MNTPSNIASAGMGTTAAGGILSMFSSLASGASNSNMYNYQASLAKLNQQIDMQNAEFSLQSGYQQNQQFGFKAGARLGQEKASLAASGLDVRTGSAAQVISSQEHLDQIDRSTIRSNAAKTAYNFEQRAAAEGSQADMYTRAADNSMLAGVVGAGTSIIGTASSVSSEWLKASQAFGPSYNPYNDLFGR